MKFDSKKRKYQMTNRAMQVYDNDVKILQAMIQLWIKFPINEITLEKVAAQSGVTVRTLLRKFGSKEGLMEACIENTETGRRTNRESAIPGSYKEALGILLDDYEMIGDASIRTLAVEDELPIAKKILNTGRANHREWCKKIFGLDLPDLHSPEYELRLLAFITATEFYLWKLLRKDLKKSYSETFDVFEALIEGLIKRKLT